MAAAPGLYGIVGEERKKDEQMGGREEGEIFLKWCVLEDWGVQEPDGDGVKDRRHLRGAQCCFPLLMERISTLCVS